MVEEKFQNIKIYDLVNLRSHSCALRSGNESSFAGELSPDVDGVSDSTYTSNYLKSDEQRGVDRGFPSSDDNFMFFDNLLFRLLNGDSNPRTKLELKHLTRGDFWLAGDFLFFDYSKQKQRAFCPL